MSANGYGLAPKAADACLADYLSALPLLPDPPDLFECWREIVVRYSVTGKPAHDARLVALLKCYGGSRVLTFNPRDFRRYADIEVVVPSLDAPASNV